MAIQILLDFPCLPGHFPICSTSLRQRINYWWCMFSVPLQLGRLSCFMEGKSLDFRSFPQFTVNQTLWQEMRLAWFPLVRGPLVLWVSMFLLTTYSPSVYSLSLDLIPLLVRKLSEDKQKRHKKAWRGEFIVGWLFLQSCCLCWAEGCRRLFLSSPSPLLTSVLGPHARKILHGGLLRMSPNCNTAPCPPKTGELMDGPNSVMMADTLNFVQN